MNPSLANWLQELLKFSQLLNVSQSLKQDGGLSLVLGEQPLRSLTPTEITSLEQRGNDCGDWTGVKVVEGFTPTRLSHNRFHGQVVLGKFEAMAVLAGVSLPTGVERCTLVDCIVGNNVLLRDVRLLSNYAVSANCLLFDCGQVVCDGLSSFGNGQVLPIGIETGGRDVPVFAEMNLDLATVIACDRENAEFREAYEELVRRYTSEITSSRGWIGERANLSHTAVVRNCLIGPQMQIEAACYVEDTTMLSGPEEPVRIGTGAIVRRSLLQWGSQVTSQAQVERSVLLEHSHVEAHGKLTASILGPNSSVAKGEVTSCLVGPFVGMHHQSLLIATIWPEGKGNIGYGANIGSNHTGKAPDQEFWPGEGAFLGLGVNVKFPADFRQAPYALIASGVTTLPQRVAFPFSLINASTRTYPGIPPAYNEILPGWLLTNNLYTLRRNESKYRARNRARRHHFPFSVFRAEIVRLVVQACKRLREAEPERAVYTENDIEGLGKNLLTESARLSAIGAYSDFIALYALNQLQAHIAAHLDGPEPDVAGRVLSEPSTNAAWEEWRSLLVNEYGITVCVQGLQRLSEMLEKMAIDVERSKAKDDERGIRIQHDYLDVHKLASEDPFVKSNWAETRGAQQRIADLIHFLKSL